MAELKHINTFENYISTKVEEIVEQVEETVEETVDTERIKTFENYTSPEEVSEGLKDLLDPRKKKIDKFLNSQSEKGVDDALTNAFGKAFGANPKLKDNVKALPFAEKKRLLTKASEVLEDDKVGPLKVILQSGKYEVGGVSTVAGTGGGRKG